MYLIHPEGGITMSELMQSVAAALSHNGFEVYTLATAEEAREKVLSFIEPGQAVGIGGSMTIRQLGLQETLSAAGHPVWWHWTSPEEKPLVLENARKADVYLASTNAVTRQGELVNIDGTGNRVASMIHGPKTVIYVISKKKLVDGGLTAAIARIKRDACPPNAQRLGLDTPCAKTGACNVAACGDECMCRATTIVHRPLRDQRAVVILVEEPLGY